MNILRRIILAAALLLGIAPAFGQGAPPPVPALPDQARSTAYSISGSTCACAVNFALYGDSIDYQSWVEVWLNNVRVDFSDPTFGWTITSPTGQLALIPRPITDAMFTFNTAQTGTVVIVGARRPRRANQFSENRGVAARDLNQAVTDITAMLREMWDKENDINGRSIIGIPGDVFAPLPPANIRANQYLCFSSIGLPSLCGNQIIAAGTNTANVRAVSGSANVLTTDCGGLIDAAGGMNTITLPAASGFPVGCIISLKNNEVYTAIGTGTGRGKILAGWPGDLSQILWPLQAASVQNIGTAWRTVVNPGRWIIPTSAEECVRQDGATLTDGLGNGTVAADCFSTPQQAVATIGTQWDGGGYNACQIGFYAGGTSIIPGNVNQTGQSIGCYITVNIKGTITWQSTGACWTGGDNSITIVNWTFGFVPTFKCNTAGTTTTGQLNCHQYCVFDINGGTAIWLPSGAASDVFFHCDLQCSATYNATVNVGDGVNTYTPLAFMACEGHCSKITVSGSLASSAHVTFVAAYMLHSGSVITSGITWPGVTATNTTTPTGGSVLITNGTTIPGGTTPTAPGSGCSQNSLFGIVCLTAN